MVTMMDGKASSNERGMAIARVEAALTALPEPVRMPSLRELVHFSRQAIDRQRRDGRQWREIAASFVVGGYPEAKPTTVARYHKEQLSKRVANEQKRKSRVVAKSTSSQVAPGSCETSDQNGLGKTAMLGEGLETGSASVARRLK